VTFTCTIAEAYSQREHKFPGFISQTWIQLKRPSQSTDCVMEAPFFNSNSHC
jgi:hypothetical protein